MADRSIGAQGIPRFKARPIRGQAAGDVAPEAAPRRELSAHDRARLEILASFDPVEDALRAVIAELERQLDGMDIAVPGIGGRIHRALQQVANDRARRSITFADFRKALNILDAEAILATGVSPELVFGNYRDGLPAVPERFLDADPCASPDGTVDLSPGGPEIANAEYRERKLEKVEIDIWKRLWQQMMIWFWEAIAWVLKKLKRWPLSYVINRILGTVRRKISDLKFERDKWMTANVAAGVDRATAIPDARADGWETGAIAEYLLIKFDPIEGAAGKVLSRIPYNRIIESMVEDPVAIAKLRATWEIVYADQVAGVATGTDRFLTSMVTGEPVPELVERFESGWIVWPTGVGFTWDPERWEFTGGGGDPETLVKLPFPGTTRMVDVAGRMPELLAASAPNPWGYGRITPENQEEILGATAVYVPLVAREDEPFAAGRESSSLCAAAASAIVDYTIEATDRMAPAPFGGDYNPAAARLYANARLQARAAAATKMDAWGAAGAPLDAYSDSSTTRDYEDARRGKMSGGEPSYLEGFLGEALGGPQATTADDPANLTGGGHYVAIPLPSGIGIRRVGTAAEAAYITAVRRVWDRSIGDWEREIATTNARWARSLERLLGILKRWSLDYRNLCCLTNSYVALAQVYDRSILKYLKAALIISFGLERSRTQGESPTAGIAEVLALGIEAAVGKLVGDVMDEALDVIADEAYQWRADAERAAAARCLPWDEVLTWFLDSLADIRAWMTKGARERAAYVNTRLIGDLADDTEAFGRKLSLGFSIELLDELIRSFDAAEICARTAPPPAANEGIEIPDGAVGSVTMSAGQLAGIIDAIERAGVPISDGMKRLLAGGGAGAVRLPTRAELEAFYANRLGLSRPEITGIFGAIDDSLSVVRANLADADMSGAWDILTAWSPCLANLDPTSLQRLAADIKELSA